MDLLNYLQTFGPIRIAIFIVSLTYLIKILHRAYFTPLSKIPGPWYARFTHLVLKYHVCTGRRLHYIHSLHQKYGPIVIIAPTEVACSSIDSFRTIHRTTKPFLKAPWYATFVPTPIGILTMIDPKVHAVRRRLFAQAFSKSYLTGNWEGEVRKKVEVAIEKIKRDAMKGEANILKWFTFLATDAIGHMCFGESFNMLEHEKETQYMEDVRHVAKIASLEDELPIVVAIGNLLNLKMFEQYDDRIMAYGLKAVQNAKSHSSTSKSAFRKILAEAKTENGEGTLSDVDIQREASNLMIAGTDTTAVTLTYLIHSVLKDESLRRQLEEEVETLGEEFDSQDVEGLTLLNAVISEALRLYGAAPSSLPRTVPKEGAILDGYFLPGDTTVCTQAYTIHRDPQIFAEPESFQPQRYLNPNPTDDFKVANHAFGAGTRTCLGIHFAKMEMLLAVALFFRHCKGARIADSMREEDMEIVSFFLISPRNEKCMITLR